MLVDHAGLYTDLYQLTMAQAYLRDGTSETPAVFDYFFRTLPFGGGFAVFAGLADFLELLESLRFAGDDIDYLRSIGFGPELLDHLAGFRFRGTVTAVREGEVVFPVEPLIRVEGGLLESQIVETALLNIVNFESLVATKAARLRLAAGDRPISEFGLRRAHGPGGILASRAAVIGGCDSTSNVYAARAYGLTPAGTMAHSYIESHGDELTAFRRYAEAHPEGCILLVDTFDTIRSGVPHAVTVAREMEARGRRLFGIRLDSGDLAALSKRARRLLDEAGLPYVKIVASNLLDERVIRSLDEQGAPIDIFGVGTRLATGAPDGSLDGVYKIAEAGGEPRLKLSETLTKTSLPGRKRVFRYADSHGRFAADAIALEGETRIARMVRPYGPSEPCDLTGLVQEPLFVTAMEDGRRLAAPARTADISAYARQRLAALPEEYQRFEDAPVYAVGTSERLAAVRDDLVRRYRKAG